jgi:glycosyltransferase involved in cell wall biosynthesis
MVSNRTVSVIIPTYNRARFISRAVESVLCQSYDKVEIIIIDDGSTDETKDILRQFKDKIRYLESGHEGTAHARNMGMRAATGRYLAFLDSDDVYLPYKIELQVEYMEEHPSIGMVCTEFSGQYENGNFDECLIKKYHPIWNERGWNYEDVFIEKGDFISRVLNKRIDYFAGNIFKHVLQDTLIATNTIFFEKKILDVVGYQNTQYRFAQEYEFVVRICKHFRVAFLDIPTYVLHFHGNQSTAFLMRNRFLEEKDLLKKIENWSVFLKAVMDWGFNDKAFYRANKRLIDDRMMELNYTIGKDWLIYGDVSRAREYFFTSYRFKRLNAKLYPYLLISMMPEKIRQSVLRALIKIWSDKAGIVSS